MTDTQVAYRVRMLPEQLDRAAARLGMRDLLQFPAATPPAGTARRADCPLPHPPRQPLTERSDRMSANPSAWVLNVHLDIDASAVMLTAGDRFARVVHRETLDLLTAAAVQAAVARLMVAHGRPSCIVTDHGALWNGLGEAINVRHWRSSQTAFDAQIARLTKAAAA